MKGSGLVWRERSKLMSLDQRPREAIGFIVVPFSHLSFSPSFCLVRPFSDVVHPPQGPFDVAGHPRALLFAVAQDRTHILFLFIHPFLTTTTMHLDNLLLPRHHLEQRQNSGCVSCGVAPTCNCAANEQCFLTTQCVSILVKTRRQG